MNKGYKERQKLIGYNYLKCKMRTFQRLIDWKLQTVVIIETVRISIWPGKCPLYGTYNRDFSKFFEKVLIMETVLIIEISEYPHIYG